jgi:hypothetical protein
MISPSEIEDQPLLGAYAIFADGAALGNFVCASIAPALLYEVNARFKGATRSEVPPRISIEANGGGGADFDDAFGRCLAIQKTCRQFGYPRGEQFASEILELIKKNEQSGFSGGDRGKKPH